MTKGWIMYGLLLLLALTLPTLALAAGEECFPIGGEGCVRLAIPSGAFPPATCRVGEIFLDTVETTDTNCTTTSDNSLCLCTATNTWVQLDNN